MKDLDGFKCWKTLDAAMARKHGFRFGFTTVFAGRPRSRQGRRWRFANSWAAVTAIGGAREVSGQATTFCIAPHEKARHRFSGAGIDASCDDVTMPVICPTCQPLISALSRHQLTLGDPAALLG